MTKAEVIVSELASLYDGADGRLASGSEDGTIRLWDAASGQEITRLETDSPVVCLLACHDGRLVAGDRQGRLNWLKVVE
jgi:WD40 repeat protein